MAEDVDEARRSGQDEAYEIYRMNDVVGYTTTFEFWDCGSRVWKWHHLLVLLGRLWIFGVLSGAEGL